MSILECQEIHDKVKTIFHKYYGVDKFFKEKIEERDYSELEMFLKKLNHELARLRKILICLRMSMGEVTENLLDIIGFRGPLTLHDNCGVEADGTVWFKRSKTYFKQIAGLLTNPDNLISKVSFGRNKIGYGPQIKAIIAILKNENNNITHLDLSSNKIDKRSMKDLGEALIDKNCLVTFLNLHQNRIDGKALRLLTPYLTNPNCRIKKLMVTRENLTADDTDTLIDILTHPDCPIKEINLYYVSEDRKTYDLDRIRQAIKESGKEVMLTAV